MEELFTFDPANNTFTVNEKDITTGTPQQIRGKKRFNQALAFTVQQARLANGTMNQYLTFKTCLLYTSPSPRDGLLSRMPSSA